MVTCQEDTLQQNTSPDTDVYMIGLPLRCAQDKDVTVQISDMNSRELKLHYTKRLRAALSNDLDLANVAEATHSKVLQTLLSQVVIM